MPSARAASHWPRSTETMPPRNTSAKNAADWIENVSTGGDVGRHLDLDQDRQREEEPEQLHQRRRGAEDLDHRAGRPRQPAARRQAHQRQHEAERDAEGERRAGDLERVEEAERQQVGVRPDRREVPDVHRASIVAARSRRLSPFGSGFRSQTVRARFVDRTCNHRRPRMTATLTREAAETLANAVQMVQFVDQKDRKIQRASRRRSMACRAASTTPARTRSRSTGRSSPSSPARSTTASTTSRGPCACWRSCATTSR